MSITAWETIQWTKVERRVLRYQTRIYKATKDKNKRKIRCIQKSLLASLDAKLLAVRKVTTENRACVSGLISYHDTSIEPGVDEKLYLTNPKKVKLVKNLRLNGSSVSFRNTEHSSSLRDERGSSLPIKRVYIPKPGKAAKRPLGIPTIKDRAKQALCKLAIEPEWEARFENNSYGFRPGRSTHDAIEAIQTNLRNHRGKKDYYKYILDADITKCFDRINHDYLLEKLDTLPEIKTQLKAWLKAGIMEELQTNINLNTVPPNTIGTPRYSRFAPIGIEQGGVISPLLANIALHGMENHMKEWICSKTWVSNTNRISKDSKRKSLAIIRYADDFVIIHENERIIEEAKEEITQWLKDGPQLELNETKTSIKNSNEGFNFLGFSCITIRRGNINRLKIYPSKDSQKRLLLKVRTIIQKNKSASTYRLIYQLNPLIIGWANYFKYSECSYVFSKQSHLIHQKLRAWCFRRDTRNGRQTIKENYFPSGKTYTFDGTKHADNWVLAGKEKDKKGIQKENHLPQMLWVKSKKWIKIKGDASPYNGDNVYWAKRTMNLSGLIYYQGPLVP